MRSPAIKASGTVYPLSALRALVLHTQSLCAANEASPEATEHSITSLVRSLGYVQIDTLHVVKRAHYVALWSRFGTYQTSIFDQLIYAPNQRRLYEGWGHAASIIPLEDYRFHRWRTDPVTSYNPAFSQWLNKDANRELAAQTLARIRAEGGLRVGAFKYEGPPRSDWYDWKPPKTALEALFAYGDLMVVERINFQRVYDVRERVLPEWVNTSPVAPEEARRFCLEQAAKALGVFEPRHLTLYAYMRATPASPMIKALIEEGILVKVRGESMEGVRSWMVHRDNLLLLQRAADGEINASRTTFLSPFDSIFWAWKRDQRLWGFNQLLECYKPASQRVYGYFCFPILHKDKLVGRFDPKLDRKTGVLHLNALYLEAGIEPDEELVSSVGRSLHDFLAWHGAKSLEIEKSNPPAFGKKLMNAL